jgi:hypothetical protein
VGERVVGQVKYLGGITFLLSDGCPETAEQAAISQYFQCIQSEKLHVSQLINTLSNIFSHSWNLQKQIPLYFFNHQNYECIQCCGFGMI